MTAQRALSGNALAALWEHGYVKLTSFATADEVRFLRELNDDFTRRSSELAATDVTRQHGVVSQIKKPYRYASALLELAYFQLVVESAKRILDAPYLSFADEFLPKPPRWGRAVPLHQDRPHLPSERPSMVTFWLALDSTDPANGCMRYVPRSHLGPPLAFRYDEPNPLRDRLEDEATDCPCEPGDVLAHLANTLHGSGRNCSERTRRCYVIDASREQSPRHLWL
jgi:ectoine hydroxylase-related dioxygenase (phytanoyl-CoA dioxygenase family)